MNIKAKKELLLLTDSEVKVIMTTTFDSRESLVILTPLVKEFVEYSRTEFELGLKVDRVRRILKEVIVQRFINDTI